MRLRTVLPLIILLTATISLAAKDINTNAGTSAFPFLKINISARAVGMGGAFTGLADDESSLYYNPAGIAQYEETPRYILGYHNMYADLQTGFIGYIKPLDQTKTIGAYVSYLNYGNFTETDAIGNVTGEFSGGDLVFATTLAYRKSYQWKFGGTIKIIYEKVQEFSAFGMAADLGVKYTSDRERYGLGAAILNLGTQFSSLGEEKDKLPTQFRGGGFFKPKGLHLTLTGDLILPIDNDPLIAFGGEYTNLKPIYLRMGWNSFGSNFRSSDSDDKLAGLSFGLGFDIKQMQISYAFTPAAELGDSHRITLTGGI